MTGWDSPKGGDSFEGVGLLLGHQKMKGASMIEALDLAYELEKIADEADDRRDRWESEIIRAAAKSLRSAKDGHDRLCKDFREKLENEAELAHKISEMKTEIQSLRDDLAKAHKLSGYYYGRAKAFEELLQHRDETD